MTFYDFVLYYTFGASVVACGLSLFLYLGWLRRNKSLRGK